MSDWRATFSAVRALTNKTNGAGTARTTWRSAPTVHATSFLSSLCARRVTGVGRRRLAAEGPLLV